MLLSCTRITRGHFVDGQAFEITDAWLKGENSHRDLGRPWRGTTMFVDKDETCNVAKQMVREGVGRTCEPLAGRGGPDLWETVASTCDRWSDAVDRGTRALRCLLGGWP